MKSVDTVTTSLPENMVIPENVATSFIIMPGCRIRGGPDICPRVIMAGKQPMYENGQQNGKLIITVTLNTRTREWVRYCNKPCFPEGQTQAIAVFPSEETNKTT